MTSYTSRPIPVASVGDVQRAELIFRGVEQAGPSFEARVFLNNPAASDSTPTTLDEGYAGSFHVYGYGEPAPPGIAAAKASQGEGDSAVAPIEKRLHADEAVLRSLEGARELTVTVVPVRADPGGDVPGRLFEDVDVVFYPE